MSLTLITLAAHSEATRDLTQSPITRGVLEYVSAILRMLAVDPYEAGRLALSWCSECGSRVCECQFDIMTRDNMRDPRVCFECCLPSLPGRMLCDQCERAFRRD